MKPKVCILRSAGTNCDKETAYAFVRAGADIEFVHVNKLISGQDHLDNYHILALSGGFSYGDDVAAGKILANELRFKLADQLKKFLADAKPIIGICNGFQVLVKSGLLPGNIDWKQEVSLIINDSGKFEDRWVYLKSSQCSIAHSSQNKCVWVKDLPEIIYLPVAHGEGKFIAADDGVLSRIKKNAQVVFQYCDEGARFGGYPVNPNGSVENIAGICDASGLILGLMPHPERHIEFLQHPRWPSGRKLVEGDGLAIFRNGVTYAKKNL